MTPCRRSLLVATASGLGAAAMQGPAFARSGPKSFGATPSPRQLAWHRLETYGFLHFTVNTFTDREWGQGDEDSRIFDPSDFDAGQIVTTFKKAGLKQLILTAKHHDGFCLWPSRFTEHCIRNSPFQNGKGDIVRDVAEACARHGLKFGIYLSPWDRNHAEYGRAAYVEYYFNQLRELLTSYGKIYEVWFDGANGGDGYYGGARETRHIDAATYYQWERIRQTVHDLQPDAVMFADANMDVRWVGNEYGVAGDPCWPTVDNSPFTAQKGNRGVRGGTIWNPAETDVSIRPGWFWHADENDKVRSPANLLNLYLMSVGRGTNLLLNVPPDRTGRISDADAASLAGFRSILDKTYAQNFAAGSRVSVSSRYSRAFAAQQFLSTTGAWAAREDDRDGAWVTVSMPRSVTFDLIRLRENLTFGLRVDDYEIDAWTGNRWATIAKHTCIGPQRLIRLEDPVHTDKVRVRITRAAASPVLCGFGLYRLPDLVEEPAISRDSSGFVTLTSSASRVRLTYTLDGSEPTANSKTYDQPFALPMGGTVKALAVKPKSGAISATSTADFDVAAGGWAVAINGTATNGLIDGSGIVCKAAEPADLVVDLGQTYPLKGFSLVPPLDLDLDAATAERVGPPARFTAWISDDGKTWGNPIATGEFANIAASRAAQKIRFDGTRAARYLRLNFPKAVEGKSIIAFAGLAILTR